MKLNRQSKLKVVLIALVVSVTLLTASVQRAHAYRGSGEAVVVLGAIMVYVTYLTAKGLVCTPVAAINASKNKEGFGGAYKDCWNLRSTSDEPAQDQSANSSEDTTVKADAVVTEDQTGPSDSGESEIKTEES